MNNTIMLKGCTTPFIIKDISARRMNAILKKHRTFFGINTISASEEITFTCLVFPVFESKELTLESLTPGQYTQLSSAVLTLNGFEEGNTGENKTN